MAAPAKRKSTCPAPGGSAYATRNKRNKWDDIPVIDADGTVNIDVAWDTLSPPDLHKWLPRELMVLTTSSVVSDKWCIVYFYVSNGSLIYL